jgi:AcrR family transcriptional regulator
VTVISVEGRRERKKRERRERIYRAAQELFVQNGFDATTVEQISDRADVAPATFFNHFPSKDAVLGQMTEEVVERLRAMVAEQLARPVGAQERIAGFADVAATELSRVRGLAHHVLMELLRTSARSGGAIPYLAPVHQAFTTILREGQEKGQVRVDRPPDFLAEIAVGAIHGAVLNWMNDPEYPAEERLREFAVFIAQATRPNEPLPEPKGNRHAERT